MTAKERLLLYLYQPPPKATIGEARELMLEVITEAVAEEREQDGKMLDDLYDTGPRLSDPKPYVWIQAWRSGVLDAAAAIRKVKP